MVIMIIIIFFICLIALICIGLNDYIYFHPMKKRKNPYEIISPGYAKYKSDMLEEIRYMDELPFEEVEIRSKDNIMLNGRLYYNHPGAPIIIFFHGYRSCFQWDGYGAFKFCRLNQMNCLMVEQRAHGKSKAVSILFGIKERFDCQYWVNYIADRFGEEQKIYLSGVSMGSATVMMASDLDMPANVKGIIADCGYTSPTEIIVNTAQNGNMPAAVLLPFAKLVFRIISGKSMDESKAIESVKATRIPMLFIHGENDDFVPLNMGKLLYSVCGSKKAMLIVPNAGHAVGSMENYELYEEAVKKFIAESV